MHDLELRAELAGSAGHVHCAKHVLPESPADGQQRVVIHEDVPVFSAGGNTGASKLAVDLPSVGVERIFNGLLFISLFCQHHAACDRFHVGVGKLHRDGKSSGKSLK